MTVIIDVRTGEREVLNVCYKWGEDDFAQISEERKGYVEISDYGGNELYVEFSEISDLIEALSRIRSDIEKSNT